MMNTFPSHTLVTAVTAAAFGFVVADADRCFSR